MGELNLTGLLRVFAFMEQEYDGEQDTLKERLRRAREVIDARLDAVEGERHRIDIVQTVPTSAPPGYLLMAPGDPNLYIGTGTGLRKVLTTIV